jgi:pimeloyl-ACP methyl ester carboxylesterase
MTRQPRNVRLASGELNYFVAGSGRPLLYLHPAGGARWSAVLDGLAESHSLYVPVAPGFDGTPVHPSLKSIADLAALYGEFIDAIVLKDGGETCDLMGCSFGGWVAAWLAVLRPERIEQLVLECPAGFRPKDAPPPLADPAARLKGLYRYPEKLDPAAPQAAFEEGNRKMYGVYNQGRARDEALSARLGEIDKLTLILHGTEDGIIPQASAQFLRGAIRRSYLTYIWDAAHAIENDQPERMLAVVDGFLKRSEAFIVNWGTLAVNA